MSQDDYYHETAVEMVIIVALQIAQLTEYNVDGRRVCGTSIIRCFVLFNRCTYVPKGTHIRALHPGL